MEKLQTVAKDNRFYESGGMKVVLAIPNLKNKGNSQRFRDTLSVGRTLPHMRMHTHTHTSTCTHMF